MSFTTNEEKIIGLFQATFARAISGKSALDAWVERFDAKMAAGATDEEAQEEILDEMGESAESQDIYDGQDDEENVAFIFNNSLGRDPSTAGAKAWVEYAKTHTLSDLQLAILNAARNNEDNTFLEEQISDVVDDLGLVTEVSSEDTTEDTTEVSSEDKNGAQKVILLEEVSETVINMDAAVKAQIHNVELIDTVELPSSLIAGVVGVPIIEYEGVSIFDYLTDQEWVDFFSVNHKNKIELEYSTEVSEADGTSYEVELKLMFDGGFAKLHDIGIEQEIFEEYFLFESGVFTMHRDNKDEGIFHVDDAYDVTEGTAAIKFVGYLIQEGLIDFTPPQ